jgi:hypothetical protein
MKPKLNEMPPSRLLSEFDVLWKLNKSESINIGCKMSGEKENRGNKTKK